MLIPIDMVIKFRMDHMISLDSLTMQLVQYNRNN